MPHEPSEAQQRAIIAAAVRYVIAEHSVTFDIATVRAASRASDALVEAVCAADQAVARLTRRLRGSWPPTGAAAPSSGASTRPRLRRNCERGMIVFRDGGGYEYRTRVDPWGDEDVEPPSWWN